MLRTLAKRPSVRQDFAVVPALVVGHKPGGAVVVQYRGTKVASYSANRMPAAKGATVAAIVRRGVVVRVIP